MDQAPPPANRPEQRPGPEAAAAADLARARTAALFTGALRQSAQGDLAESELLELDSSENFLTQLAATRRKAPAEAVAAALNRIETSATPDAPKRPWLQVLGASLPQLNWGWTGGAALSAVAVLVLVIGEFQTAPRTVEPGSRGLDSSPPAALVPGASEAAPPADIAPAEPAAPVPLPAPQLAVPLPAGPPLIATPPAVTLPPPIAPEAAVRPSLSPGTDFPSLNAVVPLAPPPPPQMADRCRGNDRVQTAEAGSQPDRKPAPDCPAIAASRGVDVPPADAPAIPAPPPVLAIPAIPQP